MPRQSGLIKALGAGVGMAAEYHEHRKQKKVSRENSQQDTNEPVAGPSSRPQLGARELSTASDAPPAYEEVASETSERSLAAGAPVAGDKKGALRQYQAEEDFDDEYDEPPVFAELEGDEAMWDLDEAVERERGTTTPPESPEEGSQDVNKLVREVLDLNRAALASAPGFERSPLPCPVILPQRRPRKKTRGFVHAYAPLLGECSGISQETFLTFLKNFHQASQASPIIGVIQLSAAIAGFAPSVIAMAVTTAVQIAAGVAEEVQQRQRTNSFLTQMNEELFQPAGLYAMVVKYKSQSEVEASGNSPLARLGVGSDKIDLSTEQTIAKYMRTPSGEVGMSQRMQGLRLASSTTKGSFQLPQSAPLIFPEIDQAVAVEGEETFKSKAKDAKGFLADYFDRKAQFEYAQADPNSSLVIPDEQRAFRSKLADPSHPMYNGGLIGFVSGGALTKDRYEREPGGYGQGDRRLNKSDRKIEKRWDKDDRRLDKYESRLDNGRGLSRKKERRYDDILDRREGHAVRSGSSGLLGGGGRLGGGGGGGRGGGGRLGGGGGRRGQGPIGMLVGAAVNAATNKGDNGQSREYEDAYGSRPEMYDQRMRRSFDDRDAGYGRSNPSTPYGGESSSYDPHRPAPYGAQSSSSSSYGYGQPAPYGAQQDGRDYGRMPSATAAYGGRSNGRGQQQKKQGPIKKLMTQDVLYLMIVNLPSEQELAEARETLARAKRN